MIETFCSVEDVQSRLEWDMDEGEKRIAYSAIVDLSIDAKDIGSSAWIPETAPALVGSTVARAAARFMRNPDAYAQSRSGDETLSWQERPVEELGSPSFNEQEKARLRQLAAPPASVGVMHATVYYQPRVEKVPDIWVPVGDRGMVHPMYATAPDRSGRYGYTCDYIGLPL